MTDALQDNQSTDSAGPEKGSVESVGVSADDPNRSLPVGLVGPDDIQSLPASDAIEPTPDNEGGFKPPGILAGVGRIILETGPVAMPLRGLAKAFRALGERDFLFIWTGAMLSNMGMWIQVVALQWLIKSLAPDHSALWLGKAAFFQQIPTVLLLPLGGVLADRFDLRWIILAGNVFLCAMASSLAVMHHHDLIHIWMLMGTAVILGIWQAALIPATQAILPSLVNKEMLPNAVALNSMQFNMSRAIGPAIGGVTLLSLGATWSFGLNALSYMGIVVAVFLITPPKRAKVVHEGVLRSMRAGAIYLRSRKDLLVILFSVLIFGMFSAPMLFMLPAIVEELHDNHPLQFTQMLSSFGCGAILGSILLAARSHRKAVPWRGLLTIILFGVCEFIIALGWPFWMTIGLTFCCGLTMVGSLNRFFAATIGSVPTYVRGRISSFYMLSLTTGFPIGSIIGGKAASIYGIANVMMTFGSLMVLAMVIGLTSIRVFGIEYRDDSDAARH